MSEGGLVSKFKSYFPNYANDIIAFEVNGDELTVHLTGDRHFKFKCSGDYASLYAYFPE